MNLYYVLGGVVLLVAIYFLVDYFQKKRLARAGTDPRSSVHPNDTNYNMSSMSDEKLDDLSASEAREIVDKARKSEEPTSLAPRDFHALQRKMKEGGQTA